MKRKLAAILILTAALIGQAVASVLPPAWAPLEKGTAMAMLMPMDCMDMPAAESGTQKSGMYKTATDNCGCCPSSGSGCTFGGCFYSVLPPSTPEVQSPIPQQLSAVALNSPIPPIPFSQLFRPPIT